MRRNVILSYPKTRVVVVTGIIVLLGSLWYWPHAQRVPTVYFPDGSTAVLVEAQISDINWRRFERSGPSRTSLAKRVANIALYRFRLLWGKAQWRVPNPPIVIDLVGNVRAFPDFSQKTYLVAEELLNAPATNWISFKFGGPRNARSSNEWVQANLDCIRTNGVMVSTLKDPYKPLSVTACAVVIDRDTVRILPACHFGFGQQSITNI
jgi:hypothetical protein